MMLLIVKELITQAKLTQEREWLSEVSVVPLQLGNIKINWSRPLPDEPTSVTIIKDAASRYFVSFVVEQLSLF